MAILVQADNEYGFESPACYLKIERFSGNRQGIELDILCYADSAARTLGKKPFARKRITIPYPTDGVRDILYYCYEQLKQLPEFSLSTDT